MEQPLSYQPIEAKASRRHVRPVYLAAALALLAACSGDGDSNTLPDSSSSTSLAPIETTILESTTTLSPETTLLATTTTLVPETTTTVAPTTTITGSELCEFDHDTSPAKKRYDDAIGVHLSNLIGAEVRHGDHDGPGECFERLVVELAGEPDVETGLPGWHVQYVDSVLNDPSGEPVAMEGSAFLQLTFGGWMYGEPGGATGPQDITMPELELIKDAKLTQNFEGYTTWTLGLDKRRNFAAAEVSGTENCPVLCIYIDVGDDIAEAQPAG